MSRVVVLDNEAIQALRDPAHPKHRRVVSHLQVTAGRRRRGEAVQILVPTAVRVEAGWDRTSAAWAFANRLRTADSALDTHVADTAAAIHARAGVSVADAHIGAVMRARRDDAQLTVITSDPGDMRLLASEADANVTIVTI